MIRRLLLVLGYLAVTALVTAAWAVMACTERNLAPPDKPPARNEMKSFVRTLDGTIIAPFVWRRLLADTTPLATRAVPAPVWRAFTDFVQGGSLPGRNLRRLLDFMDWPADRYPELVTAHVLIWLCLLGFAVTFRWLVHLCYEAPCWLGHAAALMAALLVLGGSNWYWGSFTYDIPNLFVFTLALAGSLGSRWWMLPAFVVACYSKETSVLLILAHALIHRHQARTWGFWLQLLCMAVVYAGLRWWIVQRFAVGGADQFWYPARNLRFVLVRGVYGLWWVVPFFAILAHLVRIRRELPPRLLPVLLSMAAVMIGLAFFKGWIEERRQYLELLPFAWLIGIRWVLGEVGAAWLLRARPLPAGQWPPQRQAPPDAICQAPAAVAR